MTPTFTTRKPTGRPSWPLILLAGVPASGKSWSAAEATGLPMFGRSLWIEVGEQTAEEYANVPGADYEVIEHDGTVQQIVQAAAWAAQQPQHDGRPNLLVIDSMTEAWQAVTDDIQHVANQRARKKGRAGSTDASPTMDLWNRAKDKWGDLLLACRQFPGPVVMTARLDNVAVVEGGQPTGEYVWKVRAEKNLPYAATVVVEAREPRRWTMTKIASTVLQLPPGGVQKLPDFTIEDLLLQMKLDAESVVGNTYVRPRPTPDGPQLPPNLADVLTEHENSGNIDAVRELHGIADKQRREGVPGAATLAARIRAVGERMSKNSNSDTQTHDTDEPTREPDQ